LAMITYTGERWTYYY